MQLFSKQYKKNIAQLVCMLAVTVSLFGFASVTNAAILFFSTPDASYSIGQTFSLPVYVGTDNNAINAVSGTVSFPADKLQLLSVSKAGSIITFWTQDPSFSNAAGTAQFEGVAYNPGYTGPAGNVVTLLFKVKASGSATLSFSSAAVLANDGQGTNVLDSTKSVTLTLVDNTQPTPSPTPTSPIGPHIYSPTHPDPTKWYPSGDATMKWDSPSDVTAVKVQYDKYPSSQPQVSYDPPVTERSFHVDDGVWYFHVQEENAAGWGPVGNFKFQVDTTPPGPVTIVFPNGTVSADPSPIVNISATDSLSGIDHYDLKIDNSQIIHVSPNQLANNSYHLPSQDPSQKTLYVTAYDKAGNSSSGSQAFEILGLDAPVLNPISNITQGDALNISGTAVPNTTLTIFLKTPDGKIITQTTQVDANGAFSLTWQSELNRGNYTATAQAVNNSGEKSYISKPVTFSIKIAWSIQISSAIITYLLLGLIVLTVLITILLWLIIIWRKLRDVQKRVNRKVDHADAVVHKKFAAMKNVILSQIDRLEEAKEKRKLTPAENAIMRELKQTLEETEVSIEEEVEDIKNF